MESTLPIILHDYETFNLSPMGGAASQYAATKLDDNFTETQRINILCKPSGDTLPEVDACLVTGHTPKSINENENSFCEYEFVSSIQNFLLASSNTLVVGYNSLKFDDEWTRNLLYRNFYPAYQWHFLNGNSRYDAINLMRAVYALRPHLLKWRYVLSSDGINERVSLKLEHLAADNGAEHLSAHDALSDVIALKDLMKIVLDADPEFYHSALAVRDKNYVLKLLTDERNRLGLIHITPWASPNFLGYVIPLFPSVEDKNVFWCWDAKVSPEPILALGDSDKRNLLSMKQDEIESLGLQGRGLVKIKLNQLPNLFPKSSYSKELVLGEGLSCCRDSIMSNTTSVLSSIIEIKALVAQVETNQPEYAKLDDYDMQIYSGGFFTRAEDEFCKQFHRIQGWQAKYQYLQDHAPSPRISGMGRRLIGRNEPNILNPADKSKWYEYLGQRINGASVNNPTIKNVPVSAEMMLDRISELKSDDFVTNDASKEQIIQELSEYYRQMLIIDW